MSEGNEELFAGWRTVRLDELCEKRIATRDPRDTPEEPFSYVDISSVDNSAKRIVAAKQVRGSDASSRARQVIHAGDVLVSTTRPNLNAVALVPDELDDEIASTGFCVLRPLSSLDSEFLFAFVQSREFVNDLSDLVKGALYPAVTDGQVRAQKIPLPPLDEQRRIAERLGEQLSSLAEARAALEAQLAAAESLPATNLRAVFESENAQSWPRLPIAELALLQRGRFSPRPRNDPRYYGGKFPFIQTGDVEASDGYIRKHKQTLNEHGLAVSKRFKTGTLVISIAANIGTLGMLSFDSCMPDSLVGITGKEGVAHNRFLYYALRFCREDLRSMAPQMAQANLSLYLLAPVKIPAPSLEDQRAIAARLDAEFSAANALCVAILAKLSELEKLPAALLHAAFQAAT